MKKPACVRGACSVGVIFLFVAVGGFSEHEVAEGILDLSGVLIGARAEAVNGRNPWGLAGEGVVVGFAEPWLFEGKSNGWDTHHPAFANTKIAAYLDEKGNPIPRSAQTDSAGHGTHVAGILFGDGSQSESCDDPNDGTAPQPGQFSGLVPRATAAFLRAPGASLDPYDIAKAFSRLGARVISNSWVYGNYYAYDDGWSAAEDSPAARADAAAREFDVVLVFGAGNSGFRILNDSYSLRTGSVNAPALGKNVIAVGASYNGRAKASSGFLFTPAAGDVTSLVAPFSAKAGPSVVHPQTWLIKPDLVAPGVDIISTESPSATHPPTAFDRPWTGNFYASHPGTSMAAPLVAGSAALLIEYFNRELRESPKPELVKAILVNAAENTSHGLRGLDPVARIPGWQIQGWGRVNLQRALSALEGRHLFYWSRPVELRTGQTFEASFSAAGCHQLKVTIAYLDSGHPDDGCGNACLVNDLDLSVESPSGRLYRGNAFEGDRSSARPEIQRQEEPWRRNNAVENVFLSCEEEGTYRLRVEAFRIPRGAQDFALVAARY